MGCAVLTRNVELAGAIELSAWRKIAIGTWSTCGDPSVYGSIDIDASNILKKMETEKANGVRLTPTIIVAKAAALCLREYPLMNSVLRMGKLYERKNIDIFLQVSPEGKEDNLSGMLIRNCDQKSLKEIAEDVSKSVNRIKKGDDFEYKKMKDSLRFVPSFCIGPLLKFLSFFLYGLNLWTPLLKTPRDSFGSMMVTSVGNLGIDNGFAPLVPYSRCPGLMSVGEIKKKAIVINNEICIRPILTIGVTMDHRLMDGKGASYMLKAFRKFLEDPA